MRPFWLPAFAVVSSLLATPQPADAQIFYRPWYVRPRVVFIPRPIVPAYLPPPVVVQPPPPPVVVQPYPSPYYYPPPDYYPPPAVVQPYPPPAVTLPPPPVVMQPPPPVVMQPPPPPMVMQPPPPPVVVQATPPPPVAPPAVVKPQWPTRFGIGGRFAALINTDQFTSFSQLGFGGEFLFRTSRRLVLELAGEYQKRVDQGFDRYDIPVTLGLRIHIGAPDWVLSPYLVAAGGVAYANLDFLHDHDIAWFLDGQVGGGLEIRLGKHFAISGDLRGDFRYRITQPSAATAATISIDGKPFSPMQNQYGAQFRLGAAVYF